MYYVHSFVDTASSAIFVLHTICSMVQWELSYIRALDLQYGYHKEHKDVSYALTLHPRFSIKLMFVLVCICVCDCLILLL